MTVPLFAMLLFNSVDKLDTQRIVTVRCYPTKYNQDSVNLNHFHTATEFTPIMQSPHPSVHQAAVEMQTSSGHTVPNPSAMQRINVFTF